MEVIRRKTVLKYMITKVLQLLAMSREYSRSRGYYYHLRDVIDEENGTVVPEDVSEGHFAVIAMKGEETKRFIVELDYLTDPAFLRLLEKAKEEYGFEQKGALAVPCRPQELQNIIENRRMHRN